MVGRPSAEYFERMVRGKMLKNFPITTVDIKNTHTIFGPDVRSLCRKTVRKKTETVMFDYVAIPDQIRDKIKTVEVTVHAMFVNTILFAISLGKILRFTTIKNVVDRKADTLLKYLYSINNV